MARVLLAGEQYTAVITEVKGADAFGISTYNEDAQPLVEAIRTGGHEVTWLRTCQVPVQFPETPEAIGRYDVVLLSDVGTNSLYFHPEVVTRSIRHPNRLALLREFVRSGGGLGMIGGWMSFAGLDGKARYHGTAVEEALPVTCLPYDDRQETPEGVVAEVTAADHPILAGVPGEWPYLLGYNRVAVRPQAQVLLRCGQDPLLAVWTFGKGRTAAFASDCAPHWCPDAFLKWSGYATFWRNLVGWLGGR